MNVETTLGASWGIIQLLNLSDVKIIFVAPFYQKEKIFSFFSFFSLSWRNFEKQMGGKYKHLLVSFQRYQPFYSTTNGWKDIEKNKNTAHLFGTDFNKNIWKYFVVLSFRSKSLIIIPAGTQRCFNVQITLYGRYGR